MYKILGGDQQEYGPVSADQIRQWIDEGRANGQTLVQGEGNPEWKPLSAFPELVVFLSPQAQASALRNPSPTGELHDYRLDIGACLSRGWKLFQANPGLLIGSTVLVTVMILGVEAIMGRLNTTPPFTFQSFHMTPAFGCYMAIGMIPSLIIYPLFYAGYYSLILKLIRGQPVSVGNLFDGFSSSFGQLLMAGLVIGVLRFIGLAFCILPGIYLTVAWVFAIPLIVDRQLDFWGAMELSRRAVTMHWWLVFCVYLLMGALSLAGVLACCVGVFVAGPVALGMLMYAYEDIFNPR